MPQNFNPNLYRSATQRALNPTRVNDPALEGLRTAVNPAVQLAALRDRAQTEMAHNLDLEKEYPKTYVSGATPSDLSGLTADIENDPMTGLMAQKVAMSNAEAGRQAALGGYGSPQEAAAGSRAMEMAKIEAPVRAAEAQERGALARQQESSKGALAVEQARQQGLEGRYEALQDFLRAQQSGMGGLKSVSIPGVGGVTMQSERAPQQGLLNRVTKARGDLENSRGFFGGTGQREAAELDQALANFLASRAEAPEIKNIASQIYKSKHFNKSASQLVQEGNLEVDSPDQINQIDELLRVLRGQP